jgi:hypothetical protein
MLNPGVHYTVWLGMVWPGPVVSWPVLSRPIKEDLNVQDARVITSEDWACVSGWWDFYIRLDGRVLESQEALRYLRRCGFSVDEAAKYVRSLPLEKVSSYQAPQ